MFLIKATEEFQNIAKQVRFGTKGLEHIPANPATWRSREAVSENEAAFSLVKTYNTRDDKYPRIQARKEGSLGTVKGPNYVWLCGKVGPPEGHVGVAIVVPPPTLEESVSVEPRQTSDEQPGQSQQVQPSAIDITATLRQSPEVMVEDLNQGKTSIRPCVLGIGDIVQLDPGEKIVMGSGGIGLILMRYEVKPPGHRKADESARLG